MREMEGWAMLNFLCVSTPKKWIFGFLVVSNIL